MSVYEVGQILYLTNEKSFKIIPVQVVEEVVRTTISGKIKTYLIQFPDKKKTVVDIEDIKYKCFKTENDVRNYLLENTKNAIDGLLIAANKLKNEAYAISKPLEEKTEENPVVVEKDVHPESDKDIITVDLGNGQTGRLKVEDLTRVKK